MDEERTPEQNGPMEFFAKAVAVFVILSVLVLWTVLVANTVINIIANH